MEEKKRFVLPLIALSEANLDFTKRCMGDNGKMVAIVASVNAHHKAYAAINKSGNLYVKIPMVGDYNGGAVKYAGLSASSEEKPLYFSAIMTGRRAESMIKLIQNQKIHSGDQILLVGTTSMRPSEDGRYENASVSTQDFAIVHWGKIGNAELELVDESHKAKPAQNKAAEPTMGKSSEAEEPEDLPF